MKTFLLILTLTITFLGCSHNNAFDRFEITPEQELSEDNIQSTKIKKGDLVKGIMTAVYLNKVHPKLYNNGEYFYISFYVEDQNQSLDFFLNEIPAIMVEELERKNEFTELTSFKAEWQKYYLVGFKKQDNVLNISVQSDQFSAESLKFLKD